MKAYTDLEQSRKLAKILPIESADIWWNIDFTNYPSIEENIGFYQESKADIPCWSLAALFNVINDDYYTTLYHDGVAWNITAIHHDNVKDKHNVYANTPIDACVAMILELKERNLL